MSFESENQKIYKQYLLKETPESIDFEGREYVYGGISKPSTFCILDDRYVIYSDFRTHPFIFNALRKGKNMKDMPEILNDFDLKSFPKNIDQQSLDIFHQKFDKVQSMNEIRDGLKSGRIWKNVKSGEGNIGTVISFWVGQDQISEEDINLLKNAFKVTSELYVEYINTKNVQPYDQSLKNDHSKNTIESKILPKMSAKEIINLLVKAHTNGYGSLNPVEKSIVDEYRGTKPQTAPPARQRMQIDGD